MDACLTVVLDFSPLHLVSFRRSLLSMMTRRMIPHEIRRGKIVGSPNQDGSRGSVPFYLMVRFDVHYIQSSSLFVHLWLESELLDCATAPVRACGRVRVEEQFHQHLLDDYVTDLERAEARIAETRRSVSSTPNRESIDASLVHVHGA